MKNAWLIFLLAIGGCLDPGDSGNLVPKTVDEDPTLPRVNVAGSWFHAEAFGDPAAPVVMVLHGGPGSDYRSLLPLQSLAGNGYRVVFWDQRGAGLSQRHEADSYNLPDYLEDLRQVIEWQTATPGQPFAFIGHSWGGMYAAWFINEHGDYGGRLRGAILSDPGAFNQRQLDAYMQRLMASIPLTGERLNDAFWARQLMSGTDQARADYLTGAISFGGLPFEHNDPNDPAPFWRKGAVVGEQLPALANEQNFDWTTHLAAFSPKVLFLRSELNTAATLDHQRELAASFPNAEVISMLGVGHEMIWERPEEYLAQVRAYFAQIGFAGVSP